MTYYFIYFVTVSFLLASYTFQNAPLHLVCHMFYYISCSFAARSMNTKVELACTHITHHKIFCLLVSNTSPVSQSYVCMHGTVKRIVTKLPKTLEMSNWSSESFSILNSFSLEIGSLCRFCACRVTYVAMVLFMAMKWILGCKIGRFSGNRHVCLA